MQLAVVEGGARQLGYWRCACTFFTSASVAFAPWHFLQVASSGTTSPAAMAFGLSRMIEAGQ